MKYDWLDFHIVSTTADGGAKHSNRISSLLFQMSMYSFFILQSVRMRDMWQRRLRTLINTKASSAQS